VQDAAGGETGAGGVFEGIAAGGAVCDAVQ
jgi:hypothetical protein